MPSRSKQKRITVYFSPEDFEQLEVLKREAARQKRNLSNLASVILIEAAVEYGKQEQERQNSATDSPAA